MAQPASALGALVLTLLLVLSLGTTSRAQGLELHLISSGGAEEAVPATARQTAVRLLATAGINAIWRDCATGPCPEDPNRHRLEVLLLPVAKAGDPAVSGELLRDGRRGTSTVVVYLPRVVAVTDEIRRLPGSRANRALLTVEVGHLVGLTITHEIGHSLGLPHSDLGVMAARPSVREVVELQTGLLVFKAREASVCARRCRIKRPWWSHGE